MWHSVYVNMVNPIKSQPMYNDQSHESGIAQNKILLKAKRAIDESWIPNLNSEIVY